MNKLTKLSIKKFRNVAPTTLEFRPGLNVLLGKNAAGKTTLLRLLSTAVGVPDAALQDDVLDMSYSVSGAPLDFEHVIKRTRVDAPAMTLESGQSVTEELSSLQQADSFVFKKNGAVVLRAELLPNEIIFENTGRSKRISRMFRTVPLRSLYLSLMLQDNEPVSKQLSQEIMRSRIHSAGRMDESLERFKILLGFELRREGAVKISKWNLDSAPQSMHQIISEPIGEGTSATFPLAFLDRTAQVLGYDSASAHFDVERLSPEPSRQTARLSNLRFFFKRPGEEVSHELLSYGQKRLLAFFAHADASQDLIIADELVNGLHHEWIEACLKEIGERQAFLTSQNPLLLDFLRFDSVDEVRRTFILCERTSADAGAQLIWRNPSEEEAESFFLAYQTGIQRVSDILLTKGLW